MRTWIVFSAKQAVRLDVVEAKWPGMHFAANFA